MLTLRCIIVLLLLGVVLGQQDATVFTGGNLRGGEKVGGDSATTTTTTNVGPRCKAIGECIKCAEEELKWDTGDAACRSTGFKQYKLCPPSSGDESKEGEKMFVSCVPMESRGPDSLLVFEVCMVFGAASALSVVWQRKKQMYQRLSSVMNS